MGRIAEALKRAQLERARQQSGEAAGPAVDPTSAPDPGASTSSSAGSRADVLSKATILEAPPLPESLLTNAEPVSPEAIDPHIVALHVPEGEIAEQYRSVRTRLLTGNPAGGARTFCVTSSLPREGKTVTTANLGFSLAELRHLRVAMMDLDFRRRGLTRTFQLTDRCGIADVLRGDKKLVDVCVPAGRGNLVVIPSGDPGGASPTDLLGSDAVARVVKELNDRFHYSFLDTPSVYNTADIGLVAPTCHSVLVVVRMNRTPESVLRRCIRMLQANHINVAGCILAGYNPTAAGPDHQDYYEPVTS